MNRFVMLASFLALSSAVAAPLLGSKASVNESNFCKKYQCVFVSSGNASADDKDIYTGAAKEYIYKVAGTSGLKVLRDGSNRVIMSSLRFSAEQGSTQSKTDSPTARAFALSFLGVSNSDTFNYARNCAVYLLNRDLNSGLCYRDDVGPILK